MTVEPDPADPSNGSSGRLGRAAFVGLGATAVVAATVGAAPPQQLGKPHPPIVPESDPSIVVFRPLLVSTGRQIYSYAALPKDATPATPGVVVTMHIWGVDAQIRDTVRRLAKAGFVAIAPDLYTDLGAPNGDGQTDYKLFVPFASKLESLTVGNDLAAAAAWIRTRLPADATKNTKIALLGFCMGGQITLRQTIANPTIYNAASAFYGAVKNLDPKEVQVATIGSYGARDESIPPAEVTAFYDQIRWPHDVRVYPDAGHAFFDDTRSSYVPAAAASAWTRTLGWFEAYLKT